MQNSKHKIDSMNNYTDDQNRTIHVQHGEHYIGASTISVEEQNKLHEVLGTGITVDIPTPAPTTNAK